MKTLIVALSLFLILCTSCNHSEPLHFETSQVPVVLKPDYTKITIPNNIAPLNFRISTPAKSYVAKFSCPEYSFSVFSNTGKIIIPVKKWKKLLLQGKGKFYNMEIFTLDTKKKWTKFPVITNHISTLPIDPFIVYRLIAPGYELWKDMGIYQRCLENFDQYPIMTNNMSDHNCMNCHTFRNNDPNTLLFHMRGDHAGTYILNDEKIRRIITKSDKTISAGVYPAYHPDGTKIAFSTNKTIQFFHAVPDNRIEVFDMESDIVIYDLSNNEITLPPELNKKDKFETFPNWSPDGKYLYFCSADAKSLNQYEQVKYDLLRISYDTKNQIFGSIDTIYSTAKNNKSVSFPRISPDGNWLIATVSEYGNFSIWHKSADLYALSLKDGSIHKLTLNSDRSESYHSWSRNGNWLAFSSRRDDGQYTRTYFAYFDKKTGISKKAFVLPQKDPDFYDSFMEAFNIPELVTGKVPTTPFDYKKTIEN